MVTLFLLVLRPLLVEVLRLLLAFSDSARAITSSPVLLQDGLRLLIAQQDIIVALHEGPTLDALRLARILRILENLLLLLLRAVECFVLVPVLLDGVTGRGHVKAPRGDFVPIDVLEERVALDLSSSTGASSQSLARVAIEQVHDKVLGLLGHAHGQLEDATLNVVEQLIPKFK